MKAVLSHLHECLWGAPMIVLILGVGLYLSVRTGFAQITLFPQALRAFFGKLTDRKHVGDGVTPFQALCTALAATVGTGNLVGVAGAISLGGAGAIFWMWVCGILGMATKFAEATLAVRYRVRVDGEYKGGPMYMLTRGMGSEWKPLAILYSFFGVFAAFGVGNATQINAVITGINDVIVSFGGTRTAGRDLVIGIVLACIVGAMLLGGARRIGQVAEKLVPFVSAGYILLSLGILLVRRDAIMDAFDMIVRGAFSPQAVTGGVIGSALKALSVGCSRGVFTNEAGMGTASIAHAGAQVDSSAEQGLMGIIEVFLDTIVICTLTALVILCSGISVGYGEAAGADLTIAAFTSSYGSWVSAFTAVALICFAFSTIIGWGLYGARCAEFLFGVKVIRPFMIVYSMVSILGATVDLGLLWDISDTFNGLMVIPNLIGVLLLSGTVFRLTKEYFADRAKHL